MRVALGIAVAMVAALGNFGAARAADLNFGAGKFLFFSGLDLWRHGAFSHGGALWSAQGPDREGFVAKLAAGAGSYRYRSDRLRTDISGRVLSLSLLPGWRFKRGGFTLTGFAGFEWQRHSLAPDDPGSALRGSYAGIRGTAEIWYEPTATTMVAADISATSIGPSYSARGAFGWRMLDRFYLGPEIAAFAFDNNYRQWRIGAHVTALKAGAVEWSAAIGWSSDSDDRDGIYGRLGMLVRGWPY
jgi:hypothetical protein